MLIIINNVSLFANQFFSKNKSRTELFKLMYSPHLFGNLFEMLSKSFHILSLTLFILQSFGQIKISGGFRRGALGAIAPILKKFCPYFPPEKVQKWVHITFDGRQIALFDLDRTHSPSDRTLTLIGSHPFPIGSHPFPI
jgi:hypothetical protein